MIAGDVSAVVGIFPDGEPWTRRPPCLEHLGIRARVRVQPLEKIENQVVDAVGHGDLGAYAAEIAV
jgi:hypothetical protein